MYILICMTMALASLSDNGEMFQTVPLILYKRGNLSQSLPFSCASQKVEFLFQIVLSILNLQFRRRPDFGYNILSSSFQYRHPPALAEANIGTNS